MSRENLGSLKTPAISLCKGTGKEGMGGDRENVMPKGSKQYAARHTLTHLRLFRFFQRCMTSLHNTYTHVFESGKMTIKHTRRKDRQTINSWTKESILRTILLMSCDRSSNCSQIFACSLHYPSYSYRHWQSSVIQHSSCLLYTSPSPRDGLLSRMPSSA